MTGHRNLHALRPRKPQRNRTPQRTHTLQRTITVLWAVLAAGLSTMLFASLTPAAGAQPSPGDDFELRWQSETGSGLVVGDGSIDDSTGDLAAVWTDSDDGSLVAVSIGSGGNEWSLGFATGGTALELGTWTGAIGELDASGEPLLAVNVDGRECDDPVGVFEVLQADIEGNDIRALAVDFQVGCGDASAAPQTVGALRINSAVAATDDRSVSGRIRYATGLAAAEGRACAISATTARNSRCALADRWGAYEIADLTSDDYFISFTAPDGALSCFEDQHGCDSGTYLSLGESIAVNTGIDARLELGCAGKTPTIIGTEGDDELVGTASPDVIVGLGGDDVITGLGGDDVLCGGMGHDVLIGSDGDDVLNGGFGNDVLWGQAGDDTLGGFSGTDTLRGGAGDDKLSGDHDNDDLKGGAGNDEVYGDDGDDEVRGGTGDDLVSGGAGADFVNGNGGMDDVFGGSGDDVRVIGGPRPDMIYGGDGDDFIQGLGGADTIDAGAGDDDVRGGKQNDMIIGGAGTDSCNGGTGDFDAHTGCETTTGFELN